MNNQHEFESVHIDRIKVGDAIFCPWDSRVRTVTNKDIHKGGFCGTTIFGNCWNVGNDLVKRVVFKTWHVGNIK